MAAAGCAAPLVVGARFVEDRAVGLPCRLPFALCTPWASDRVVLVADLAGSAMFAGEWRKFRGRRNPVRVPP